MVILHSEFHPLTLQFPAAKCLKRGTILIIKFHHLSSTPLNQSHTSLKLHSYIRSTKPTKNSSSFLFPHNYLKLKSYIFFSKIKPNKQTNNPPEKKTPHTHTSQSIMKLLTINFLTCAVKACKSSPLSFPLHFRDAELERQEIEYNPIFLRNILPRLDWDAVKVTAMEVCIFFFFGGKFFCWTDWFFFGFFCGEGVRSCLIAGLIGALNFFFGFFLFDS